jgi:nucleoside-diphosphate-sugar epimerase
MKAVVTGGGGFVGGAICRRLHALGHDVTALGRRPNPEMACRDWFYNSEVKSNIMDKLNDA